MKCLVVDESATMRRILRNALKAAGCDDVIEAEDGKQAIERCDGSLDAVVTEWSTRTLDGIELVRRLRADPGNSQLRILMITARNARQDVLDAVRAGVNGYLLKPFAPEALKLKIEELVQPGADAAEAA